MKIKTLPLLVASIVLLLIYYYLSSSSHGSPFEKSFYSSFSLKPPSSSISKNSISSSSSSSSSTSIIVNSPDSNIIPEIDLSSPSSSRIVTTSNSPKPKPKPRVKQSHPPSETPDLSFIKDDIWSYPSSPYLPKVPVLGPQSVNGTKPLFGFSHSENNDAVFALASKYTLKYYRWFVGSLRKTGFTGDIVLAVSPVDKMKEGVYDYLKKMKVLAYEFDVECSGVDNCKLNKDFLGFPDPRPHRTFANIRYALYEYWLMKYKNEKSYIMILDFRDTFFQRNPFEALGEINSRSGKYDLRLYAENEKVKHIGNCVFNSLWIGRCFGRAALLEVKEMPVLCSGSTLASLAAARLYVSVMLRAMDEVRCWLRGIESDQGYHNFLFYNGFFNSKEGNATLHLQGTDLVNTIGALNGKRVSSNLKGSLESLSLVDSEGFVINRDGSRSFTVHQWDRFYQLNKFIDKKLV